MSSVIVQLCHDNLTPYEARPGSVTPLSSYLGTLPKSLPLDRRDNDSLESIAGGVVFMISLKTRYAATLDKSVSQKARPETLVLNASDISPSLKSLLRRLYTLSTGLGTLPLQTSQAPPPTK
jgi:hypothetical protein